MAVLRFGRIRCLTPLKRKQKMKKVLVLLVLVQLLISCATTMRIEDDPRYMEYKKTVLREINEYLLTEDKYINLNFYYQETEVTIQPDNFWSDTRTRTSQHREKCNDDLKQALSPYETVINDHNRKVEVYQANRQRELQIAEEQRKQERIDLSLKRVPGNRDWLEYQERYNLENIYSNMVGSNDVIRLRLEFLLKEMDDYAEDKNLISSEDQSEWINNVMTALLELGMVVNFGSPGQAAAVAKNRLNELLVAKTNHGVK
jgi:hypothetical protein